MMGKRVWIKLAPLVAGGPPDANGMVSILGVAGSTDATGAMTVEPYNPYKPMATKSCGHGKPHPVSFFASSGDPVWCDECEGTCLACGAPATTCVNNTFDWGEACDACAALPKETWPKRVEAQRFNVKTFDEHVDCAAHFMRVAISYEKKAADRKHKFWDYERSFPLWWTHTREGKAASAKEMFAKSVMHFIAAFVSERPAVERETRVLGSCVICKHAVTGASVATLVDNKNPEYGGRAAHYMCWEENGAKWRARNEEKRSGKWKQ